MEMLDDCVDVSFKINSFLCRVPKNHTIHFIDSSNGFDSKNDRYCRYDNYTVYMHSEYARLILIYFYVSEKRVKFQYNNLTVKIAIIFDVICDGRDTM